MTIKQRICRLLFTNFKPAVVGLVSFLIPVTIFANPVLDNIASGQVSIQQAPNTTVINQTSQKGIINWQSFNIGANELTHFQQPAGGITLNRINPAQGVSQIYGRLTATGKIILVNPAGIFFGPSSFVNVGGLIASTANISDQDFLNNYYHFANDSSYNGAIVNQGQIIAADHGLIALVGGAVSNEGFIQANVGQVALASGDAFTMSFAGNDLIGFTVDRGVAKQAVDKNGNQLSDGVSNTGTVSANGGRVLVTAKDASGVLDNVINLSGIVEAKSVYQKNGEIIISGDPQTGVVKVAGKLDASGTMANSKGGNIDITGFNILLDNTANLTVSGDIGAGNINIGGNYQGKGLLANANAVVMSAGAQIHADALTNGNGGNVILWSDYYTRANGHISARGGSESGNGGFVETSGKTYLDVNNIEVSTAATNGITGQWLLDPADLTITNANANVSGASPFQPSATGSTLNVSTLTSALAANNIIVQTNNDGFSGNGDIIINTAIGWNSVYSLTLSAYRNITSSLGGAVINNAGSGVVNLRADNTGTGTGTVVFTGGSQVTASGGVNIFYNPTTFGTNTALYTGGTTPTQYMLIQSLGNANDAATARTLGALSNNTSLWGQNFALAKNIDASVTSSWNSGAGFAPIGSAATQYTGKFDGQNYAIDNLYINAINKFTGLFGEITAATIQNVKLTNASVMLNNSSGPFYAAGILAGVTSGASLIQNVMTSGNIGITSSGTQTNDGGIVGSFGSGGTLTASYSLANVTGRFDVGGLTGGNSGTISQSYFAGTVNQTSGIYSAGGISGYNGGTISNTYNIGSVTGTGNVGGLVGYSDNTINNSYSSGVVSGGSHGGLVGIRVAGTVNNSFWDTQSSGQASSSAGTGKTTAEMMLAATFSGWSITGTASATATAPANTWFVFNSVTRPLLMSEYSTTITNAHQLQLMGTTLGANYKLANNIDMNPSMTNAADIWGTNRNIGNGAGFYPIGTSDTGSTSSSTAKGTEFSGSLNGQGYIIDNLYIYRPTKADVGLFGSITGSSIGDTSTIQNLSLTNVNITGQNVVGALAGYSLSQIALGTINNIYISGSVTAAGGVGVYNRVGVGALIGSSWRSQPLNISNVYSTASVTSSSNIAIGGLIGYAENAFINNSYASGLITSFGGSAVAGGIAGTIGGNDLLITNSFWDTLSTGQLSGYGYVYFGSPTVSKLYGGCFGDTACGTISNATNASGAGKNLSLLATYTSDLGADAWSMTATSSTSATKPSTTWFIFNNATRPMLMMEYNTNVTNAHQLQLMATTLDADYTLANNIDLYNPLNNQSDVWASESITNSGTGFHPIGIGAGTNTIAGTEFTGSLNGKGYTISNLYINNPLDSETAGLFGSVGTGFSVNNLGLYNVNVRGSAAVGALVGNLIGNGGNLISNVFATGSIYSNPISYHGAGGLVGVVSLTSGGANIENNIAAITIKSNDISSRGGIVGFNSGGIYSNNYYDVDVAGTNNGIGTALTTAQMMQQSSFTGLDFTNTWTILENSSYPYLRKSVSGAARVISGTSPAIVANTVAAAAIRLVTNGTLFAATHAGANGFYYFFQGLDGSATIANNTLILAYIAGDATKGSVVTKTPGANGSVTNANIFANQFTIGTDTAQALSTYDLQNVVGASPDADTLYTFYTPWNHLYINAGYNVATTANTTFDLGSNMTADNGSMTFAGIVNVIVPGPTLTLNNSGTLTLNALNLNSNSMGIAINAGTSGNINGVISGAGSFTKIGNGTLVLNANNTYSGVTTISGGTLQIGSNSTSGSLSSGNVTNNGALVFVRNNDYIVNNVISGSGSLTQAGSGTLTLGNAANSYTGATAITNGILSVDTLANGGVNSSLGATAATTAITLSGGGVLSYTGGTASTNRQFATSGTGGGILTTNEAGTLTLAGNIANGGTSLTFNNTGNITAAGIISGSGLLIKSGVGTLTLAGANTFTGAATINGGTLNLTHASALGANGGAANINGVTVTNGATLNLSNVTIGNEAINLDNGWITATGTSSLSGAIGLVGNGSLGGTGNLTLSGIISGSGSLSISGSGSVNLLANNTFVGDMQISGGNFTVRSATTLNTGNVIVNNANLILATAGLTLTNNFILTNATITDNGTGSNTTLSGNITLNGTQTFNIGVATSTMNLTGTLSGGGITLNKTGLGTLTLTKANNGITGTTNITAGTLRMNHVAALGTSAINVNGILQLGTVNGNFSNNVINLNGGTILSNNANSNNIISNAINLSGNNIINANNATNNVITINGGISGSGNLTKAGSGMLLLANNNNSFSGATTITGGIVSLQSNAGLGTGSVTVSSGASLLLAATSLSIANALTLNAGSSLTSSIANSSNAVTGAITLGNAAAVTMTVGANATLSLQGKISGTGGTLTKSGTGKLQLANSGVGGNASTYSGATNISAGTVEMTSGTALGTGVINVNAGNSLLINGNNLTITNAINLNTTGALSSVGTNNQISGAFTLSGGSNNIAINNVNDSLTLSGIVTGASGRNIIKSGSGTLALLNANSILGTTTVNGGTLSIGHAGALGNSVVTMNAGSTFNIASALGASVNNIINLNSAALSSTGNNVLATGVLSITGNNSISSASGNLNITRIISGAGSIAKSGNGEVSLSAANTYSGGTTLNNGTLTLGVGSTGSVGNVTNGALGTNTLTMTGGTLQSSTGLSFANAYTINGFTTMGGNNNLNMLANGNFASGKFTVTNTGTTTLSGNLNGAAALTMNAASGTLVLNSLSNASFSGNTQLDSGTLTLGTGTDVLGTGTLILNGGTLTAFSAPVTLANHFNVMGNTNLSGSYNITFNGTGDLNAGTTLTKSNNNLITFANALSGSGNLTINAGEVLLSADNTGFSAADSYAGLTTINNGGTFTITNDQALGYSSVLASGGNSNGTAGGAISGGILKLAGVNITTGNHNTIELSDGVLQTTGTASYNGAITLNSTSSVYNILNMGGNFTLNGNIDGVIPENANLRTEGAGHWYMNGEIGGSVPLLNTVNHVANTTLGGTDVYTTGNQSYFFPINLINDARFISANGDIMIYSTIDGAHPLTVSTSGQLLIEHAIGQYAPVESFTMLGGGVVHLNGGTISTLGSQIYNGSVVIANDTTFNAANTDANIIFNQGVSGIGAVTVNGGGNSTLTMNSEVNQLWDITQHSGNVTLPGLNGIFSYNNIQNFNFIIPPVVPPVAPIITTTTTTNSVMPFTPQATNYSIFTSKFNIARLILSPTLDTNNFVMTNSDISIDDIDINLIDSNLSHINDSDLLNIHSLNTGSSGCQVGELNCTFDLAPTLILAKPISGVKMSMK